MSLAASLASGLAEGLASSIVSGVSAPAAGISYVGGVTEIYSGIGGIITISLTSLTGGSDTAPSNGDLVVVFICNTSNTTRLSTLTVTTAGYSEASAIFANSTWDSNQEAHYKTMGANPDTSVDVYQSATSSDAAVVFVRVYRGVDSVTPMDVTAVTAIGTGANDPDPASITPVTSGAWIVIAGQGTSNNTTPPAALTEAYLSRAQSGEVASSAGYAVSARCGDVEWTSGAYDGGAMTCTEAATGTTWAAIAIALRPA